MLGMENSIWDDGEWVSWHDINSHLRDQELRVKFPNADISLIPIFEDLLGIASEYHRITGKHLQVYGDIGELYGAIMYGVKLHKNYSEGSDGRLKNDFVEVKTITPFKKSELLTVKRSGNFNKLLIVRINEHFEVSGQMINRSDLPKGDGKYIRINWHDFSNK